MSHSVSWVLVVVGAVLVVLEILLGALSGFDLLLLGSAILLGGAAGIVSGTPLVGIIAAAALSLAYFVGRRRIHRRRPPSRIPFQHR